MILKLMALFATVCCGFAAGFTDLALIPTVALCVAAWLGGFLLAGAAAVGFLWFACSRVDYNIPQEEDSKFYRNLAAAYIEFLIQALQVRVHPSGLEKTPKEGQFLLVCNHLFDADPGILLHYFKDSQLSFISKQENRKLPFVGPIMHKILCQLLDREDDRQALRVIQKCVELIKADKCSVAVFPEGYCSKDGKLHPFRNGVFKIAMKTKVPIVVCTLRNTKPILHNGLHGKPTDVELHLVDVIQPQQYAGMKTTELGDMVYGMMLADLGDDFAP